MVSVRVRLTFGLVGLGLVGLWLAGLGLRLLWLGLADLRNSGPQSTWYGYFFIPPTTAT